MFIVYMVIKPRMCISIRGNRGYYLKIVHLIISACFLVGEKKLLDYMLVFNNNSTVGKRVVYN